MTLSSISLISNIDCRSESSYGLKWAGIHDFVELLRRDYVLYQVVKSCYHVIIELDILKTYIKINSTNGFI